MQLGVDAVKVVGRKILEDFKKKHADARAQLDAWLAETEDAEWESPNDIKARYASASFLGDNRVIFNIGGNKFRLIVHVNYDYGIVFIKFVGTHSEYNRIDPETV